MIEDRWTITASWSGSKTIWRDIDQKIICPTSASVSYRHDILQININYGANFFYKTFLLFMLTKNMLYFIDFVGKTVRKIDDCLNLMKTVWEKKIHLLAQKTE